MTATALPKPLHETLAVIHGDTEAHLWALAEARAADPADAEQARRGYSIALSALDALLPGIRLLDRTRTTDEPLKATQEALGALHALLDTPGTRNLILDGLNAEYGPIVTDYRPDEATWTVAVTDPEDGERITWTAKDDPIGTTRSLMRLLTVLTGVAPGHVAAIGL